MTPRRRCDVLLLVACSLGAAAAGADIEFRNVDFEVNKGKTKVLQQVHGRARPGRILAIMGPSGSGKTSLLNALAGTTRATKGSRLTGTLLVDGQVVSAVTEEASGVRSAYVRQQDVFYSQMTVRETLMFSARLRLPSNVSSAEREALVDGLLRKLSLVKAADTIVGDVRKRGISGGERKRLSIGCELLGRPDVLFLDEPTSGLDAFQAERVVESLRTLAKEDGVTIVTVLHQPRGSIFGMLDDLILVAEGRTVYAGTAAEAAKYMESKGFRQPRASNAAEFVVDTVSTDFTSKETRQETQARVETLARMAAPTEPLLPTASPTQPSPAAASLRPMRRRRVRLASSGWTQFRLLLRRSFREVARSRGVLAIKVVQQVAISLIYGSIYTVGNSQASIQDRFGLVSLVAIGAGNIGVASTVRAFPKEKTIVTAERAKGIYGIGPYFAVLAEAPVSALISAISGATLYPLVGFQRSLSKFGNFLTSLCLEGLSAGAIGLLLGAAAPSSDVALALFPPITVLTIIFNGLNIAEESTPRCLRWLPKLSFIRWTAEAIAVNEFRGLTFDCEGSRGACCRTGEQALERVSFHKSTVKKANMAQGAIIAGCYAGSLASLQRSQPKLLGIVPPRIAGC